MNSILHQLKKRRLQLGLKQKDMYMRIGLSRQQYQRLESKGNPRLNTLELIAQGLNSGLMLIPKEKAQAVKELLEKPEKQASEKVSVSGEQSKSLDEDPWQDLLEVDHEE